MPTTIKSMSGVGFVQAGEGVGPIANFSGGAVGGPIVSVIFRLDQRNVANIASTLQVAPNAGGIDGFFSGNPTLNPVTGEYDLAVAATFIYSPDLANPHRWTNISGFVDFPDGVEATDMTGVSSQGPAAPFDFEAWLAYKDPSDPNDWLNPGPSTGPQNIDHVETDSVDSPGDKDETFSWDLPVENLVGTIIQRDGTTIAVLGVDALGDPIVTFVDTVIPGNTYEYTFYFYYLNGDGISDPVVYPPVIVGGDPAVIPLVTMTMGGGIDFGGAPSIGMIVNPSGIYGLIPNLTHDTLYERIPTITSINVKIPDPFGKTGFLPEN